MEITINIDGCMVSVEVSTEVAECLDAGRRKSESSPMSGGATGTGEN